MNPILIPILIPLGAFAMVFGLRYFSNKERMSMIEKGMDLGVQRRPPSPLTSLKWGLILTGVGLGLFLAFWLTTYVLGTNDEQSTPIYFGMIGICGGLGLIISYFFEKKAISDQDRKS